LRLYARRRFAALALLLLSLPACGIVFSAGDVGTEVFREFQLTGEKTAGGYFPAGSEIAVTLTVNQAYPVPIAVSCRYENVDITDDERRVAFNERTSSVFETVLPGNPGHEPGEHEGVQDEVFEFAFEAPEPGDYFIACFVVAAPENGIGRGFTTVEE
jgi:hypothetical protein